MFPKLVESLSSVAGRVGLGVISLSTLAVALPVADGASFSLEKTVAVALAIGGWLWAEIESAKSTPHPHDLQLFADAQRLMNVELHTLREQNFGAPFNRRFGSNLYIFRDDWKGVSHTFQDKVLQQAWSKTLAAIELFLDDLYHCGSFPNSPDMFTVKTMFDIQSGTTSQQTEDRAKRLNENATALVGAWDRTVQIALARLKTAAV